MELEKLVRVLKINFFYLAFLEGNPLMTSQQSTFSGSQVSEDREDGELDLSGSFQPILIVAKLQIRMIEGLRSS